MNRLSTHKILSNLNTLTDRLEHEHAALIEDLVQQSRASGKQVLPQSAQFRLIEIEQGGMVIEAMRMGLTEGDQPL